MKQKSVVKSRFALLAASALLASSVWVSSGWAQERPERGPRKPVEAETPRLRDPIDPRLPILLNPPVIESPSPSSGFDAKKPLVVTGSSVDSAHIRVIVKGELELQVGRQKRRGKKTFSDSITYANSRGAWKTEPIKLDVPARTKVTKLEISAVQSVSRNSSKPHEITVHPVLTFMPLELPPVQATLAPMLTVTTPKDGTKLPAKDKRLLLEGTAIGGNAVNVQMTMEVHMTNGNWFTGGEKRTRSQIHRRVDNVPVKNGKWSTYIDITPHKGAKGVTKIDFDIFVSLQGQQVDKRIRLTQ